MSDAVLRVVFGVHACDHTTSVTLYSSCKYFAAVCCNFALSPCILYCGLQLLVHFIRNISANGRNILLNKLRNLYSLAQHIGSLV